MGQMPSRVLAVWIDREPAAVYDFASRPENFPLWASGLCSAIRREGGRWIAETPHGAMEVRFSPINPFGVLDHVVAPPPGGEVVAPPPGGEVVAPPPGGEVVVPPPGGEILVPMRVLPNGGGAEVSLVLLRQPDMSDDQFEADARWVLRDLEALKRRLEGADRG